MGGLQHQIRNEIIRVTDAIATSQYFGIYCFTRTLDKLTLAIKAKVESNDILAGTFDDHAKIYHSDFLALPSAYLIAWPINLGSASRD